MLWLGRNSGDGRAEGTNCADSTLDQTSSCITAIWAGWWKLSRFLGTWDVSSGLEAAPLLLGLASLPGALSLGAPPHLLRAPAALSEPIPRTVVCPHCVLSPVRPLPTPPSPLFLASLVHPGSGKGGGSAPTRLSHSGLREHDPQLQSDKDLYPRIWTQGWTKWFHEVLPPTLTSPLLFFQEGLSVGDWGPTWRRPKTCQCVCSVAWLLGTVPSAGLHVGRLCRHLGPQRRESILT